MEKLEITVPFLYSQKRLDAYLTEALGGRFSRVEIKAALQSGRILLNGKPAKPSVAVKEGDRVEGSFPAGKISTLTPENIPVKILHEDESLIIVDKPAGMVVHPGAGNKTGTLVHALLGRGTGLSDVGDAVRPGIVHRLDKDTSGVLVVAKNNLAHRKLQAQFEERSVSKTYLAIVKGDVDFEEGHVWAPLGRHPRMRNKMAVSTDESGKEAQTQYRVLKRFKGATYLAIKILTGRTHQIRVHMAHLGHPVLGDKLYGTAIEGGRLALHASVLEFEHPETGEWMRFESPLPDDFKAMLEKLEKKA